MYHEHILLVDFYKFIFKKRCYIEPSFLLDVLPFYGIISLFTFNCDIFDGKPITYGFENPYYTIFGEMLLLQYNHWHFISYVMVNKMDLEHYSA